MNRINRVLATLGTLACLGAAPMATAGPLWEFDKAGNSFSNGSWVFGTSFAVQKDLLATGLGYYADPIYGQVSDNPVALYECANADCTTTGTLLASVLVDNTYALTGHFRYVTIAPVSLVAGRSYQVVGVSLEDNYTWDDDGFVTDPNISLIALDGQVGRWESGTSLKFLNYGQSDLGDKDGFWGPNVFVGEPTFATPEPASLALIGLALAALAASRRKRRF